MIRISTSASKAKAIDVMTAVLDVFIFNFAKAEDKEKLVDHMERLKQHPGKFDVHCRMETFPEKKLTRIVIDAYAVD